MSEIFLLVHFPAYKNAAMADSFLQSRSLVLRRMEGYGIAGALRLSVGTNEANQAVVAALKDFLK